MENFNDNNIIKKDLFNNKSELFDVSNYAIRKYNFVDPNEVIYYHMWEEELCPYSEYIFDKDAMKKTYYNEDIIRGLEEWGEMRERRMKGEISDNFLFKSLPKLIINSYFFPLKLKLLFLFAKTSLLLSILVLSVRELNLFLYS